MNYGVSLFIALKKKLSLTTQRDHKIGFQPCPFWGFLWAWRSEFVPSTDQLTYLYKPSVQSQVPHEEASQLRIESQITNKITNHKCKNHCHDLRKSDVQHEKLKLIYLCKPSAQAPVPQASQRGQ